MEMKNKGSKPHREQKMMWLRVSKVRNEVLMLFEVHDSSILPQVPNLKASGTQMRTCFDLPVVITRRKQIFVQSQNRVDWRSEE